MLNNIPLNLMKPAACAAVVLALATANAQAQDVAVLKSKQDKESYAVGVDLARNLKRRGVELQSEALLQGVRDVITGRQLLMTEDDLREALRIAQIEARQRLAMPQAGPAPLAATNAAQGAAFLAQNKTQPGVVVLPSGLQYKILKPGTGPKPAENDTVVCNFRAAHIDGREFNSSSRAGQPAVWKIKDDVPAGIREALLLMPVGSKWQLFVPPQLAYGERGAGSSRLKGPPIGPNETLIFEIELLAIK